MKNKCASTIMTLLCHYTQYSTVYSERTTELTKKSPGYPHRCTVFNRGEVLIGVWCYVRALACLLPFLTSAWFSS